MYFSSWVQKLNENNISWENMVTQVLSLYKANKVNPAPVLWRRLWNLSSKGAAQRQC